LQVKTLPPNVQVGPVSHDEYIDLLRSAEAVVVALRSAVRRSAGQQTYLNAMWFGKPTIVTDAIGVRDFVADGVNGLVVDGTVEGYLKALRWISDPANVAEVSRLSAEAQRTAREDFSLSGIVRCIFAVVDELIPGCV
jgi:glycosyltransferase involved in cell wall biosynthesis